MGPDTSLQGSEVATPAPTTSLRQIVGRCLAAIGSAVIPGLGQLAQGRTTQGVLWMGAFAVAATLVYLLRPAASYIGFVASIVAVAILAVASSWDALRYTITPGARRAPWPLLVLPVVAGFVFGSGMAQLLHAAAGFKFYDIPSSGMAPTIELGDRIVADKRAYQVNGPSRGDVITFKRDGTIYLKRAIGLPGETVEIHEGVVYINRQPIQESYVRFRENQPYGREMPPLVIPANQYFVLGDNRDVSLDSRADMGLIKLEEIIAKLLYVWDSRRIGKPADKDHPLPTPTSGSPNS